MTTIIGIPIREKQVRVTKAAADAAFANVLGADVISAVSRLRFGPGRTCEALARVLDSAATHASESGVDPKRIVIGSATAIPAEDIVRVRRKAHGKADWIASATCDIDIELVPEGLAATHMLALQHDAQRRAEAGGVTEVEPFSPADPDQQFVHERLFDVIDPDLGINIVDLGFVRRISIENRTAIITMTLTSAACPLTGVMEDQIRSELVDETETTSRAVDDFRIEWEWTPSWKPADISEDGREQLRAIGFTV